MVISAIVAVSKNGVIGKGNQIPWYLPEDLKYFKKVTLGHPVIMGRKSFLSIGRPLPKRTNIIVTRDPFFVVSGCIVVNTLEEALEWAMKEADEELFIIGGGEIFEQSMPYWDKLYLTEVDLVVEDGEVFFPPINREEWQLTWEEHHEPDEKNEHAYTFQVFERTPDTF